MIKIMIQFDGKFLTLPVNPEEITISASASNTDIDIIGLGKATRKGDPDLPGLKLASFFPAEGSYWYTGVKPKTCIEFIQKIWNTDNVNNNVAKIVTIGLPIELNMYFVIDSFDYNHKAGEEEDIYYELSIKKYVPYGAKTISTQLTGLAAARAASTTATNSRQSNSGSTNSTVKTYTVVKGDCLWNITKKYTGNGSQWRALYELNKKVIGNNPNLIYPGQVLTIPSGW